MEPLQGFYDALHKPGAEVDDLLSSYFTEDLTRNLPKKYLKMIISHGIKFGGTLWQIRWANRHVCPHSLIPEEMVILLIPGVESEATSKDALLMEGI
jgi:hypothetical protein